jgi:hypothetical protein
MNACIIRSTPWLMMVILGTACSLFLLPGCEVSTASPDVAHVAGRVTFEGRPVKGGAVVFIPSDVSNSFWGAGVIRPDGRFVINRGQSEENLVRGRYDIIVRPGFSDRREKQAKSQEAGQSESAKSEQAETTPKPEIPERYQDVKTSGLWVNLERDSNWVEINLQEQKD